MARMLTLEGAPRTPKKEEQERKAPAKPKPDAPRMGPGTRPLTHVEEQIMEQASRLRIGQVGPDGSSVAAEQLRRIRDMQTQQAQNRLRINLNTGETNVPIQNGTQQLGRAARQRPANLGHLFDPAPATKPSVTVLDALRFLAQPGSVSDGREMLSVIRDMAGRSIVSAKQHSYAKSICLKPHNRALLNAQFDLRALNAEEFTTPLRPASERVEAQVPRRAKFPCSVTSRFGDEVTIDFMYRLSTRDGKGKVSVRSVTIPIANTVFSGANVRVPEMWLRQRGIDTDRIHNIEYE